jgi:hypothetical protein
MPWNLSQRDGKWCVVKQGESSPVPGGCHSSRTDAIKHQRALYANESRMASMYAELDEITEDYVPEVVQEVKPSSELVRIEIGKEHDHLIASLSERMDAMAQRSDETQQALVAALQQIGMRESVVNVEAPNVHMPPAEVNVHVPPAEVTVHTPEVTVRPEITVEQPQIDFHMPAVSKTVTFERDPLTGQVSKAEVTEA